MGTSRKSLDSLPSGRGKDPRWEDRLDLLVLKPGEPHEVRQTGIFYPHARHWVALANDPKKAFPKVCASFNPETGQHDRVNAKGKKVKCWACVAGVRIQKLCVHLVFDEEAPDDKKTGFKPLKDVNAPYGLVDDIQKAGKTNRHKDKKTGERKTYPTDDPKYGVNIFITNTPNAEPSKIWTASGGSANPLSKEQIAYVEKNAKDYDALILYPESESLKADLIRNEYLNDDGTPTDRAEREKAARGKDGKDGDKKGGGKKAYESEDAPKAKGKTLSLKVKPSEDSEDGSEDGSEDSEKPAKGKSKDKPAAKGKSKAASSEAASSEAASESEAPKSKSKGKTKPKDSEAASSEGSEDGSEAASSEAPKAKAKGKKAPVSSEADSEDGSESEAASSEAKPAKGKSKKSALPAVDDSEDASSEAASSEESEKPKKKSKK